MWDSHWAGHASIWLFYCPQVPSALAFQSATHNIISFINLTNMSISNNNKSLDKCILRVNCVALHNKSKSWLLHRQCVYTVATEWTYVRSVCTVWSYVCSVCIEQPGPLTQYNKGGHISVLQNGKYPLFRHLGLKRPPFFV